MQGQKSFEFTPNKNPQAEIPLQSNIKSDPHENEEDEDILVLKNQNNTQSMIPQPQQKQSNDVPPSINNDQSTQQNTQQNPQIQQTSPLQSTKPKNFRKPASKYQSNCEIQIKLDQQSLVPMNGINMCCQFKVFQAGSQQIKDFYEAKRYQLSDFSDFMIKPIKIITKGQANNQEHKDNDEILNKQEIVLIFNTNGFKSIKQLIAEQHHLTTKQRNILGYRIIQIWLILFEANISLKINKENLMVMIDEHNNEFDIKLMAVEWVHSNSIEGKVEELQRILKFIDFQLKFSNLEELTEIYIKFISTPSISEQQQFQSLIQELEQNQKFFNEISAERQSFVKQKNRRIQQSEPLMEEQVKWLCNQMNISYQGHYLHYKSSIDCFNGQSLSKIVSNLGKTDQKYQLIIIQFKHKERTSLIGFITTCFSNPDNKEKMAKYAQLGFYLSDPNKKTPSTLINFDLKTIHPLTDEKYCVGYDPKKLLFCIGKCDIILSDGNLSNLCYFPISYQPDFDGIVNTAEQLCGGRSPKLMDLYVYRLKK